MINTTTTTSKTTQTESVTCFALYSFARKHVVIRQATIDIIGDTLEDIHYFAWCHTCYFKIVLIPKLILTVYNFELMRLLSILKALNRSLINKSH